jgi:peptidylprolyl isomerase
MELLSRYVDLTAHHQQRVKARKAKAFRRKIVALIVIVLIVASLGGVYILGNRLRSQSSSQSNKVLLKTSMGDITIELFDDMPITTGNFKNLVKNGVYDGTFFHRVVHDFVIQGGDASGKGINVSTIPDELPNKHSNVFGSVAMAKTDQPNSANSQFFINLKDNSKDLDSRFSVFGTVIAGINVVNAIGNVATDSNDRPLQDVIIVNAEFVS